MEHFIKDCTDRKWFDDHIEVPGAINAYIGFDCTTPSLHVGHLIPLMFLRRLQLAKQKTVILIGRATTVIGDPSVREETRETLDRQEIRENGKNIREFLKKFFALTHEALSKGYKEPEYVDNMSWWGTTTFMEMMNPARYFSVNEMLKLDFVRSRLKKNIPLSMSELCYLMMQSHDFLHLNRHGNGCNLQIGGADQWDNITHGVALIQRTGGEVCGIATPLLFKEDGTKMSKTTNGTVWLNPWMSSDYDYWHFFRNVRDEDVKQWLHWFTDLETDTVENLYKNSNDINDLKVILAYAAIDICRGQEADTKQIQNKFLS